SGCSTARGSPRAAATAISRAVRSRRTPGSWWWPHGRRGPTSPAGTGAPGASRAHRSGRDRVLLAPKRRPAVLDPRAADGHEARVGGELLGERVGVDDRERAGGPAQRGVEA